MSLYCFSGIAFSSRRFDNTWSKYIFHGDRRTGRLFGIYKLCQKINVNRRVGIFLAAFLGDLFTYCVTSIQLAFAYPSEAGGVGASAVKFLGVFAPTQIPLAVIEGILTVVIVIGLETYAKPELRSIGFFKNKKGETQDE